MIKKHIASLEDLYFKYYDRMYEIVKGPDGGSSFTAFEVWGAGRTAKVQCDFSSLMSPKQYREFVLPSLKNQCDRLDYSIYHLDGPDAIKHIDAIMEIESLNALQWTSGAAENDGSNPEWYPIFDKVLKSDKSIFAYIFDGDISDWINGASRLVDRYGSNRLYLIFKEMSERDAEKLLNHANKYWC